MTLCTHAVVILAITGAAAAQWPAPSSQPATAPPAAEPPGRSEGGATVTLSGCLSAADPGGATTAGRPGFVLTDVTDLGPQAKATDSSGVAAATAHSTAGATRAATRPAERYLLVAADTGLNLSKHANARVKVTGTVNERTSTSAGARDDSRGAPTSSQPGGAGAQHALSTLTVHSITPAEGTCGR
jgi:hypothetical protein